MPALALVAAPLACAGAAVALAVALEEPAAEPTEPVVAGADPDSALAAAEADSPGTLQESSLPVTGRRPSMSPVSVAMTVSG